MIAKIIDTESKNAAIWDKYAHKHSKSNLYHLFGWQTVIKKTYGHKAYYIMAINQITSSTSKGNGSLSNENQDINLDQVAGILPLIHLKHFLFGNRLISLPFFDMAGLIANDAEVQKTLLYKTIQLARNLGVKRIELRHINPLSLLNQQPMRDLVHTPENLFVQTSHHKVRMLLSLPDSADILMNSFKSKLRSQIRKPIKEGLKSKVGGLEFLDDFYKVFSSNMRDLGSPVHSKRLIKNALTEFSDKARIMIVYKGNLPLAGSLVIGYKDTLENPWASSLREYSRFSPNMLLYWAMLEYACDNGFSHFDFGRSSPDEGTYKFKEQWGAKPMPLNWHYLFINRQPTSCIESDRAPFTKAIQYWQKLPVFFTRIIGPLVRKHIGL